MPRLLAASCFALACACGSSTTEPTSTQLSVGGTYATAVTLVDNTCSNVTVQPNPTTVSHQPGATALGLTHASISYQGTVQNDGAFSLTPKPIDVGGGTTHTLTIAGRFTTSGFTATVDAVVRQGTATTCTYRVSWVGTRQSGTNVIPGP